MEWKKDENQLSKSQCIDLVVTDAVELCLGFRGSHSPEELNEMVLQAAAHLAPPAITAAQLLHQSPPGTSSNSSERALALLRQHNISTNIAPRLLTELCGAAGAGKTQFCLSMAVDAVCLHSCSVIYIDTERSFNAARLIEIGLNRYPERFSNRSEVTELASSVHVFSELSCESLKERLHNLDSFISSMNIGLIIVDSIAAGARSEFADIVQRQQYLSSVAARLKKLAARHNLAVLLTNQVSSSNMTNASDALNTMISPQLQAALGMKWHHAVNVRFLLHIDQVRQCRTLELKKSPTSACTSFPICIGVEGVYEEIVPETQF